MRKQNTRTGACKVTFELPPDVQARSAYVCGDFNGWSSTANRLTRRKDGHLRVVVPLEPGRAYRFRYLLDDGRWENDWQADAYAPNIFGTDDSVVAV